MVYITMSKIKVLFRKENLLNKLDDYLIQRIGQCLIDDQEPLALYNLVRTCHRTHQVLQGDLSRWHNSLYRKADYYHKDVKQCSCGAYVCDACQKNDELYQATGQYTECVFCTSDETKRRYTDWERVCFVRVCLSEPALSDPIHMIEAIKRIMKHK